jgi:hypothetical protein
MTAERRAGHHEAHDDINSDAAALVRAAEAGDREGVYVILAHTQCRDCLGKATYDLGLGLWSRISRDERHRLAYERDDNVILHAIADSLTRDESLTGPASATVEVLTAEVRVLMVGSRQITLSVYRQLDEVAFHLLTPFGRVRSERQPSITSHWDTRRIEVVGADRNGRLARSWLQYDPVEYSYRDPVAHIGDLGAAAADWDAAENLPLIVLAGLR